MGDWAAPELPHFSSLLIAVAVATLAWFAVLGLVAMLTRPRPVWPGPTTSQLGAEPPAVVHLITNGWTVAEEAAEATLVDLAARGFLEFQQLGPDPRQTIVRLRDAPVGLAPYEQRVLDRVRALAHDGVVPLDALAYGTADEASAWLKRFRRVVIAEARARRYSQPRMTKMWRGLLGVLALIPAALAGVASQVLDKDDGSLMLGIGAWVVLFACTAVIAGETDTPTGRAAARHWLGVRRHLADDPAFADLPPAAVAIWDRYLAYAAALGAARLVLRVLELGPEDPYHVWSAYGGVWRRVRIRYPRRPGWGRAAHIALLVGLGRTAAGILLLWKIGTASLGVIGAAILVVELVILLWGLATVVRAVLDLVVPRRIEGSVLSSRTAGSDGGTRRWLAVDDGRSDRARAFVVPGDLRPRVSRGDIVRATAGSQYGLVRDLELVRVASAASLALGAIGPTDDDEPPHRR